jgi:carbon-monoxide dehydrogenase large subunit
VHVLRYFVAYEVGRAINPTLVRGQITGGFAQGLGGALLEEFRYDASGQPLATQLIDYLLPTAAETPRIGVLITEDAPSGGNPLGAKGAGEGGVTAVGAALASAVSDALGRAGAVTALPMSPQTVSDLLAALPGPHRHPTKEHP